MTTFKIAYIGDKDEDSLLSQAQEYFKQKNLNDKDFDIVFEDVSNMSKEEIQSKSHHLVSFDVSILDSDKSNLLKEMIELSGGPPDLQLFPFSRQEMSQETGESLKGKISDLSDGLYNQDVITDVADISDTKDIRGYLDELDITSGKYRELAGNIFERRKELRSISSNKILEAYKAKDELDGNSYVTYDHVKSVAKMSKAFSEYLGFDNDHVETIEFIAIAHDVGKIVTPRRILNSKGALSPKERKVMGSHDEKAKQILDSPMFVTNKELAGIVGHHGKEIDGIEENFYGDFIALIDSFDAMTSQREYNNPKEIWKALEDLEVSSRVPRNGRLQFKNRELVEKFIAFNCKELYKSGFDPKALIENNLDEPDNLLNILDKYKSEIEIGENDKREENGVTELGYKLTQDGKVEYVDKTLKPRNAQKTDLKEEIKSLAKNDKEVNFSNVKTITEDIVNMINPKEKEVERGE